MKKANQFRLTTSLLLLSSMYIQAATWVPFDSPSPLSSVTMTLDGTLGSNVVSLNDIPTSQSGGYQLGASSPELGGLNSGDAWNNLNTNMEWKMKYSENCVIYVIVNTTEISTGVSGPVTTYRYLKYTSADDDCGIDDTGKYIHHGLGSHAKSGTWQTITRDLQSDLNDYEPSNVITNVIGMRVIGSGSFDDITLGGTVYEDAES